MAILEIATFPLINTVTILLSHILQDSCQTFLNLSRMFLWWSSCAYLNLVLPSAILDFAHYHISSITSWGFSLNFLHMDSYQPPDVSLGTKISAGRPSFFPDFLTSHLLNTITISLLHLLQDYWSDFFENCLGFFLWWRNCAQMNLAAVGRLGFVLLLHFHNR